MVSIHLVTLLILIELTGNCPYY